MTKNQYLGLAVAVVGLLIYWWYSSSAAAWNSATDPVSQQMAKQLDE